MLKFCKYILIFSWIEHSFLLKFKILNLEKQFQKVIHSRNKININCKNSFQSFIAFSIFTHSSIMYRISSMDILLSQNLSISVQNIPRILFKQVINSNIEIFMPFNSFRIMKNWRCQMTIFNIHIFESISIFFFEKLIKKNLF